MGRWKKWAAAHVIVLAGVTGLALPGGEVAAQANATLDSSSGRPVGSPDRNVPEDDAADEGVFTLTISTVDFPENADGVRFSYGFSISGTNALPADVLLTMPSGNNNFFRGSSDPVVYNNVNDAIDNDIIVGWLTLVDLLIVTFRMRTASDTDLTDEILTLHITAIGPVIGGAPQNSGIIIDDTDGNGNPLSASLTIWDPGTAKIAADDTDIAEDETTDFTVTLAGLRSTDSESRAVDHWPVRVDFPAGVAFTKNGRRLESDLYDVEISDNIPAADIAVSDDPDNAIIISVRPAAIATEVDEEAGKEVITYTFRPKPGAHAGMPEVDVTLAALTGVTVEGTLTNSIYVPAAARELTFNIGERLGPLPDPTITAVSIDDDNNLEDDPTDTIAENGTIVVTVTLDTPIPVDVTDTMVTYVVEPRGTAPVSAADITAFTQTQTSASAEGSELTFSIEITEDNRIEFNEQGLVRITSVVWNGGADGVQSADSTAGFTIEDNDRINLSVPDATVSENTGSFEYTVTATAAPVPANAAGVVLDREVTAILSSDDGSATLDDDDYARVANTTVAFPASAAMQTGLTSDPEFITVVNDGDAAEEFTLILTSSGDAAAGIADEDSTAAITIAPDPVSVFSGVPIVALTEGGAPATRTLTVSRAPGGGSAIVSFGVSGGTVSTLNDSDHDFRLGVAAAPGVTDVTDLTVSNDNTSATFTIPADNFTGGVAAFTLTFTPIIDADTQSEDIAFNVTGIEFPGNPDYGVGAQLSSLTITVAESVAALTRPDGAASENDETGHFTVSLTDRLAGDAAIVAELSGNANFPGPQDADYGITVFPTGDRVSAIASDVTGSGNTRTLAFSMATGTDAVDVVVSPLADGYDEPQENVVLRLVSATFLTGAAAVDQPDPADRTVAIADHSDDVSDATLDKSGSLNEAGPVRGTFTLKLLHAPDENAAVAYAFATGDGFGILGTNYTVPITGAGVTTALTNAAGTFTIPRANITGSGGGVEGGNPGEAVATITVTPVNDNDAVSEDVTLTINTITFGDNISTHGDLVAAAICPAGSATCAAAGSQTLRIMDDDIAAAAYDSDAAITLTEGSGIGETRTLRLTNAPAGTGAVATFTLTGGTTTGATDPDVLIEVGGGADTLASPGGTGGTFRIPPNDSNVTITFTPADNDNDALDEVITFSITGIDFENSDNDVNDPLPLTVNVNERPEATVSLAVTSEMGGDSIIVEVDSNDGSGPDDTATITLTVGNVPAVATAVEITYTLTVGGFESSATDVSIAGASVGTGLTLTLDSLDRNVATASAVVVVTAQSDNDGDDEMVTFTVTRLSFTDAAFADRMELTDSATILVDDNAGGICPRTRQVYQAILAQISGDVSCANAIPHLGEVNTLTFTGLSSLQPGDFDDLDALAELNLSGSNDLRLPAGIFDDVLDTLTTLTIDDRLKGNLSFAGPSEVRQGGTVEITVQSSPAFVAVEATITVTFGGDEDAADFSGLSTQKITFGSNEAIKPIRVTAGDDATPEATATFAFGEIILVDGNGNPSALQTDSLIVPADPPDDTHTLTIKERALRLRIRTFLEGALQ